jgi:hypothetical protein
MKLPEFNLFCDKSARIFLIFPGIYPNLPLFTDFFLGGESSSLPPVSHAYVYDHQRKKAITLGSDGVCFPKLENSHPPPSSTSWRVGEGVKNRQFSKNWRAVLPLARTFPCSKEILALVRNLQENQMHKEMARKNAKIKGKLQGFL